MEKSPLVTLINNSLDTSFGIDLPEDLLKLQLVQYIDELINTNFGHLVFLLYRIDVDEQKLKDILVHTGGANAAEVIADLILQRMSEKMRSREIYRTETLGSEEEKL